MIVYCHVHAVTIQSYLISKNAGYASGETKRHIVGRIPVHRIDLEVKPAKNKHPMNFACVAKVRLDIR